MDIKKSIRWRSTLAICKTKIMPIYQKNENGIFYIYVVIYYWSHVGRNKMHNGRVWPWTNDSISHSIFSSTFDLKVER